jgi:cytoplasmic iron level regulating protein YaaA (DUF328/UPF0246 family)
MRFSLFISRLFLLSFANGQKTIKVRKGRTLQGFYQLQTEDKIKEFLYFDNNGNIAIITSKNRKKAKGNLVSCIENDNCQTAKKTTYKIDSLEIAFSFNRGSGENIHFVEFDGIISPDALLIILKKGETGKIVEVKEFRRLKD